MQKFSKEEIEIINKVFRREAIKDSLRNIAVVAEIIVGTLLVIRVTHILLPLNKPVAIIALFAGLTGIVIGAFKIQGYKILPKRFTKKGEE